MFDSCPLPAPPSVAPIARCRDGGHNTNHDTLHMVRTRNSTREHSLRMRYLPIPFYAQHYDWDCGLACCEMIRRFHFPARSTLHNHDIDYAEYARIIPEGILTKRIWTIDLAVVLASFGISVDYFTTMPGVNPSYSTEMFYETAYREDCRRINKMFRNASSLGIQLHVMTLPMQHLKSLVTSRQCLAIVLVDMNIISSEDSSFAGHYVIVAGYDSRRDLFLCYDPSILEGLTEISSTLLDKARSAFGTDHDTLIIPTSDASVRPISLLSMYK